MYVQGKDLSLPRRLASSIVELRKEMEHLRDVQNILLTTLKQIEVNEGSTHTGVLARNAIAAVGRL